MIYLQLFLSFLKIGLFGFGGGLAIFSLIQHEIEAHGWMTQEEFVDILAVSQVTPGPIGINCATYTGYTAVIHAGFPTWAAMLGAILASLSVIWLPFLLMVSISKFLLKHSKSKAINDIFSTLRLVIVGLIAAAAIMLMSKENFGNIEESPFVFFVSTTIFILAFLGTRLYKIHPILMILLCGLAGLLIY